MASGRDLPDVPVVCVERERRWLDEVERCRSFLTVDDQAVVYCPDCAERESDD